MAQPHTLDDLIVALSTTLKAAQTAGADIGTVLTDQRIAEGKFEVAVLLRQLQGAYKGVMVTLNTCSQREGPGTGELSLGLGFMVEFIYPFSDNLAAGKTSWQLFRTAWESMNNYLNSHRTFGLLDPNSDPDQKYRHNMLQSQGPAALVKIGEGTDGTYIHYWAFDLNVPFSYYVAQPEV